MPRRHPHTWACGSILNLGMPMTNIIVAQLSNLSGRPDIFLGFRTLENIGLYQPLMSGNLQFENRRGQAASSLLNFFFRSTHMVIAANMMPIYFYISYVFLRANVRNPVLCWRDYKRHLRFCNNDALFIFVSGHFLVFSWIFQTSLPPHRCPCFDSRTH